MEDIIKDLERQPTLHDERLNVEFIDGPKAQEWNNYFIGYGHGEFPVPAQDGPAVLVPAEHGEGYMECEESVLNILNEMDVDSKNRLYEILDGHTRSSVAHDHPYQVPDDVVVASKPACIIEENRCNDGVAHCHREAAPSYESNDVAKKIKREIGLWAMHHVIGSAEYSAAVKAKGGPRKKHDFDLMLEVGVPRSKWKSFGIDGDPLQTLFLKFLVKKLKLIEPLTERSFDKIKAFLTRMANIP